MSRPATRKQLLESIEHLKKMLTSSENATVTERQQRYITEQKIKEAEAKVRDLEYTLAVTKETLRNAELHLAQEDARAEAFEFVLRLQNKAPVVSPEGARDLPNDLKPHGLDASIYGVSPTYDAYRGPR